MASPKAIGWFRPYWFTLRRNFREARYLGLLSVAWWARVFLISTSPIAAITTALTVMTLYSYPATQIPWTRLLFAILSCPPMFAALLLLPFGLPEHVQIKPKSISVGQLLIPLTPSRFAKHNRLHRIRLVVRGRWTWLSGRYITHRGTPRTLRCMVGERVDLHALDELVTEIQHAIPTNNKPDPVAGSGLGLM